MAILKTERAVVVVHLEIKVAVEITDSGYLGVDSTVVQHLVRARDEVAGWQWFVKKDSLESKPIAVETKVTYVSIIPV